MNKFRPNCLISLCCVICFFMCLTEVNGQPARNNNKENNIFFIPGYVMISGIGCSASITNTNRFRAGILEDLDIINVIVPKDTIRTYSNGYNSDNNVEIESNGPLDNDEVLITMSILPDKFGHVNWTIVNPDTIALKTRVRFSSLTRHCFERVFAFKKSQPEPNFLTRSISLRPIIKINGAYLTTSNSVLTDCFLLRDRATWFPDASDGITINCLAKPVTLQELTIIQNNINKSSTTLAVRPNILLELTAKILVERNEKQVVTFWSIPPRVLHADILFFGIGDFKFKPGTGIISGKYAEYFYPGSLGKGGVGNSFFKTISTRPLL